MSTTTGLLFCVSIGFISGVLNVVAGGGSFFTLPLLLLLGLPASVANGTNRVGVLAQNIGGVFGFHRHGVLEWGSWPAFFWWASMVGFFRRASASSSWP